MAELGEKGDKCVCVCVCVCACVCVCKGEVGLLNWKELRPGLPPFRT